MIWHVSITVLIIIERVGMIGKVELFKYEPGHKEDLVMFENDVVGLFPNITSAKTADLDV